MKEFRAWYIEAKAMFEVSAIDFDNDVITLAHDPGCFMIFGDGVILEQWTGLTDSEGVKIFEGDKLGYSFDGEEFMTCPVHWVEGSGMWGSSITLNQVIPEDIGITECQYKVIGTIHEDEK